MQLAMHVGSKRQDARPDWNLEGFQVHHQWVVELPQVVFRPAVSRPAGLEAALLVVSRPQVPWVHRCHHRHHHTPQAYLWLQVLTGT